ncbi:MAG: signal peptide peptidase SppA [Phycisphaerales bacterium JB037]
MRTRNGFQRAGRGRSAFSWFPPVAATLAALLALGGCADINVSIGLGSRDAPIAETEVLADDNPGRNRVAMIDLRGVILDGRTPGVLGPGANPVDAFLAKLDKAREDDSVRAIIVRISSPGGTVTASDVLYSELRRFSEETGKPIVAQLGDIATSGGYYAALGADEIVAHPMGITGSIGVVVPTFNVADGMSSIGIRSRSVVSASNKDLANPFEPMEEAHYAILQGMVDEMYAHFRRIVLERRPDADRGKAESFLDGRVFTGAHAVRLGLADSTGGVREAFDRAKALAGIDRATLVKYHDEGMLARSAYARGQVPAADTLALELKIPGIPESLPTNAYYLWMPGSE